MKQKILLSLITILILPVHFISAQTGNPQTSQATSTAPSVTTTTSGASTTVVTIANINLTNLTATKNSTSSYSVSFVLTNKGENQTSIFYTFSLLEKNGGVVATQSFAKPVTLEKDKPTLINEIFALPKGISGTYSIRARALTDTGLPVGVGVAENIVLKDTELVKLATCAPDKKSYEMNQTLTLICSVTETKKGTLTSPSVGGYVVVSKLFYNNEPVEKQSAVGEIVKGKATIEIKNVNLPGTYTIRTTLQERGGSLTGKELNTLFTVNGTVATILNTLLDKNIYTQGEDALATVAVSIKSQGTSSLLSLATTLVGKDGDCSASSIQELPTTSAFELSLPIIKNCADPTLTVRILTSENKVLAEKTLSVKSPAPVVAPAPVVVETNTPSKIPLYGGIGAGILLLLALGEIFIFRKMRQASAQVSTEASAVVAPVITQPLQEQIPVVETPTPVEEVHVETLPVPPAPIIETPAQIEQPTTQEQVVTGDQPNSVTQTPPEANVATPEQQ